MPSGYARGDIHDVISDILGGFGDDDSDEYKDIIMNNTISDVTDNDDLDLLLDDMNDTDNVDTRKSNVIENIKEEKKGEEEEITESSTKTETETSIESDPQIIESTASSDEITRRSRKSKRRQTKTTRVQPSELEGENHLRKKKKRKSEAIETKNNETESIRRVKKKKKVKKPRRSVHSLPPKSTEKREEIVNMLDSMISSETEYRNQSTSNLLDKIEKKKENTFPESTIHIDNKLETRVFNEEKKKEKPLSLELNAAQLKDDLLSQLNAGILTTGEDPWANETNTARNHLVETIADDLKALRKSVYTECYDTALPELPTLETKKEIPEDYDELGYLEDSGDENKEGETKNEEPEIIETKEEFVDGPTRASQFRNRTGTLSLVRADSQGVQFEQEGRWFFRVSANIPPPREYKNVEKKYHCSGGTFINFNATFANGLTEDIES